MNFSAIQCMRIFNGQKWRQKSSDRGVVAGNSGLKWLKMQFSYVILPNFLRQETKISSNGEGGGLMLPTGALTQQHCETSLSPLLHKATEDQMSRCSTAEICKELSGTYA